MEEGHLSEGERQAERDKQKTEISRLRHSAFESFTEQYVPSLSPPSALPT